MNAQIPLTDEAIRAAIARRATSSGEHDLRERVLAAAAVVPQRRGWRVRVEQTLLPERSATLRLAAAVLALVAMAIGIALVGGLIRTNPGPLGGLAYRSEGDIYVAGPAGEFQRRVWDLPASADQAPRQLNWLDPETVLLQLYDEADGGIHLLNVMSGEHRLVDAGGFVALSPDRRLVAIELYDAGATPPEHVRLMDIASGVVVGDIPGWIRGYPAVWSPDGRSIVGKSPETIERVDIGTGVRTILAAGLCCGLSPHYPTWSPDGARILYVDYHEAPSRSVFASPSPPDCFFRCGTLWTVDAAGAVPTRLTPELGSEIRPAYSPDGRWIAYIEEDPSGVVQQNDIVVVAADGTGRRVLTPPPEIPLIFLGDALHRQSFAWDPDSGGLSYLSFGDLWHITLSGRASSIDTPLISEFARQVVP